MPHIQAIGFYMVQQWYAVENLVASTISDTRIDLAWSIIQAGMTGITIEYSTDGVTYSYLDFVGGSEVTYSATGLTTNTQYWFRARGVKSGTYSEYCTPADDWTAMKFVVDSFGTGAGRAGCSFKIITEAIRVTIDGNGLFWTNNTGGTSSTTWNIAVGSSTRYVSVSSGSATILIFHKNNVTEWGIGYSGGRASLGWNASAANSPRITLTTSGIVRSLQHIALGIYGASGGVVTGTWASLPTGLISFYINGGSVNITGAPADLPQNLEVFTLISGGALIGDCVGLPSSLKSLYLNSSSSNVSGNVSDLPTSLEYVSISAGTTITGNVSGVPQNGLLWYFYVVGSNTISGDVAGLDYSGCVLEYVGIHGSNTISGDVAGIPECIENISIGGNNTITGDVAGIPNVSLISITITGRNTIYGDIADIPPIATVSIDGDNVISGDIGEVTIGIKQLTIQGDNTITGDVAGLDDSGCVLTRLTIDGVNTMYGDIGTFPTSLTYIAISGLHTLSGDVNDLHEGLQYFIISGNGASTISGDIGLLPSTLLYLSVSSANTIYGDITDVPAALTTLSVYGSNTISGDITNWPTTLTQVYIIGSNTITGPLSGLTACTGLSRFQIYGANTIYGDLNDLPSNVRSLIIEGSNAISDYTSPSGGKTWPTDPIFFSILPASGGGLSSTEVDDLIIDLAASITATRNMNINLRGNNAARTSASDAAVATLAAKNRTVLTNP